MERDLELYRLLLLTRAFEGRVHKLHAQNQILGGIYSGRGQEATVVGTAWGLDREDYVFPLHRDIGVFLAKGVEPRILMAQLFGKTTGLSRGKDSFLHGGMLSLGIYGATSMLGSTLPVACGVALRQKLRGEPGLCVAYFGEGAASRGEVHEAMNFAAIRKLPIIFVCENNGYAYSTPVSRQMAIESVAERAQAYGMYGARCDGNDLEAVLQASQRFREGARAGKGPALLECRTYRLEGHSAHDRASYRNEGKEELAQWEARDPIERWERYLAAMGVDVPSSRATLMERIDQEIEDAVRFAEESPAPGPEEAMTDLYASWTRGTPAIARAIPVEGPEVREVRGEEEAGGEARVEAVLH